MEDPLRAGEFWQVAVSTRIDF